MAPTVEQNPVTGVKEPYFPEKTRLSRMFTGSMVIVLMVSFICRFMGGRHGPPLSAPPLLVLLPAMRGDHLPGDGGDVPRHHQRHDVPHRESRAADRGTSQDAWRVQVLEKPSGVCCPLQAATIANISSSIVNLGLILLMGQVYTALAEQLTKWGRNQTRQLLWDRHTSLSVTVEGGSYSLQIPPRQLLPTPHLALHRRASSCQLSENTQQHQFNNCKKSC